MEFSKQLEETIKELIKKHDAETESKAIKKFADWCYINGIDFSYMSTSQKSGRKFIDEIIRKYQGEQEG